MHLSKNDTLKNIFNLNTALSFKISVIKGRIILTKNQLVYNTIENT